jgi:intracellular sulfur oxidation DsrE/DsrF family protein
VSGVGVSSSLIFIQQENSMVNKNSPLCVALNGVILSCALLTASPMGWAQSSAQPSSPLGMYVKPEMTHESYGVNNVVVPMATDVTAMQGMKLKNIANGLNAVKEWHGQMNVTVVVYSRGITLLESSDERVRQAIDALRAQGVRFVVCNNTLREMDIDFHDLYHVTAADIVPSGFMEVAFLQTQKHYVVDPAL